MSDTKKLVEGVLGVFLLAPLLSVFYSFVLVDLWKWFIVPLGVTPIGMAHAYGLALTLRVMAPEGVTKEYDSVWEAVFVGVFTSLIVWAMGGITYHIMGS